LFSSLVTTDILAEHLNDPGWILIDCRFDLQSPDWGWEDYQKNHIPGAVYARLDHSLSSPVTSSTGRHPLPIPAKLIKTFSTWGIDATKQVVVYDTVGGSFAARLWWLLRYYGHTRVAVLDGSFPKWITEHRPTRNGIENHAPAIFVGTPDPSMVADAEVVNSIRQNTAHRLIDARNQNRFLGINEPVDAVAGRIPGAVNRFHGLNLNDNGTFLSPEDLRIGFEGILGSVKPEHVIVYCGSGVTSCHHLLAMEYIGMKGARLYPGSWSEWIRDPDRPRGSGPE